ncbi:MAG: DUF1786 family protein [Desulfobacterales bacterium]
MSRYLIIDIGAGTMDILYYDDQSDLHYKAVVKSPVRHLAEEIEAVPGNLLVTGCEMGGGPVSTVLKARAADAEVVMTSAAAATIHHNPDRVQSSGIRIVSDTEAASLQDDPEYHGITTGDLQIERIERIVKGFGMPFQFDAVGICAQDHGVPPGGMSHLDYRHSLFQQKLEKNPFPHALLFRSDEIPPTLNRLVSIAESARRLPTEEIYVMDSGMAAILGASTDVQTNGKQETLVLDIATSHTVGATLSGGEIAGFFEYHTHDITRQHLEDLTQELADGDLSHEQILREGGHGAFMRKSIGFQSVDIILATGPKRKLLEGSHLPIVWGAPLGDNMMTGTVGVLEAIRKRKGLPSLVNSGS